jgi:hypothetical protein
VKSILPDSDHGRWAAATVDLPPAAHPEQQTLVEKHTWPPLGARSTTFINLISVAQVEALA